MSSHNNTKIKFDVTKYWLLLFLFQNSNLRIKSREREDLGVNLFNLQEEVNHSQKQLASHNKLLAELEDTRATLEKQVNQTQVIYKEAAQKIAHFKEQGEHMCHH